MRIERLSLRDFRNLERAEVEIGKGLTVLTGPNGAGKSNLLEGLYFACTGHSCRTRSEREVVRFGADLTRASVEGVAEDGRHILEVGFRPGELKRARVDGEQVERLPASPLRPLVGVFVPERLELVRGAPAVRRAHLDHLVAALWPARAEDRAAFGRALAQRNALLARVRSGGADAALLDPWDAELARHGATVTAHREGALELVRPAFRERAAMLGLSEPADVRLRSAARPRGAEDLMTALRERRDDDIARGFTTHGPQRDDLALLHAGRPLRTLGSQGQQRVGLLALLFAERDVLGARWRPPLMLLDDVMSELDRERRLRLSALLRQGGQAVVTTTDAEHVPGAHDADVALALVEGGQASQDPALLPATS